MQKECYNSLTPFFTNFIKFLSLVKHLFSHEGILGLGQDAITVQVVMIVVNSLVFLLMNKQPKVVRLNFESQSYKFVEFLTQLPLELISCVLLDTYFNSKVHCLHPPLAVLLCLSLSSEVGRKVGHFTFFTAEVIIGKSQNSKNTLKIGHFQLFKRISWKRLFFMEPEYMFPIMYKCYLHVSVNYLVCTQVANSKGKALITRGRHSIFCHRRNIPHSRI